MRPKKQFFINETDHVLCSALLQETVPVMSGGINTQYKKAPRIAGFLREIQTWGLPDPKYKC